MTWLRTRARRIRRWAASQLHRRPGVRLAGLLSAPLAWLLVAYLGSLAVLLVSAFWSTDVFTGEIVHVFTLDNFRTLVTTQVYRDVALRTVVVAALVTVLCAAIGFPIAFFMAKVASRRWQRILVVAVLTPLWASYLVKAFAWRVMLLNGGVVDWLGNPVGVHTPGFGLPAVVIVLAYLWLPYMILPIYAGLERLPDSLVEASADLGGRTGRTFRSVILPLAWPAVVAGSVFTFSLSLGDYITVQIVGGKQQMIGNLIYTDIGTANNLPLAAALATIPVVVMIGYLLAVRRTGALESL